MQPKRVRKISIEGFRPEEIVALPDDQIHEYVFQGDKVVFLVGEAQLHGEFRRENDRLVALLSEISFGGEEIIPSLAALLSRYARLRQIPWIAWEVHVTKAVAKNGNLGQILDQRGYHLEDVPGVGKVYRLLQKVDA